MDYRREYGTIVEKVEEKIGSTLTAGRRKSFLCDGINPRLCYYCYLFRYHLKRIPHDVAITELKNKKWGDRTFVHINRVVKIDGKRVKVTVRNVLDLYNGGA